MSHCPVVPLSINNERYQMDEAIRYRDAARDKPGQAAAAIMRCPKRLEWTPAMVKERLQRAMRVFKALPLTDRDRPSGRMVAPLPIVRTLFQDEAPKRARMAQPAPPAPAEVDHAYEALTWVGFLRSVRDRKLVLARAGGVPWAALEPRLGLSERQLRRRYQLSLRAIAVNLIFRAICA